MSDKPRKNDRQPPPDPSPVGRAAETSLLGMITGLLVWGAAMAGFVYALAALHGGQRWAVIGLCAVVWVISLFALNRVVSPGDRAIAAYAQRAGWRDLESNESIRGACRTLAAFYYPEYVSASQYPRSFLMCAEVSRPGGTGYVAVANTMAMRDVRGQKDRTIATTMYVWIRLPIALPAVKISQALPGERGLSQNASTLESGDFNRRFVVNRWRVSVRGESPLDEAGSRRYISALITPQIMQTLLDADRVIGPMGLRESLLGTTILKDRPHSAELALDAMFAIAEQIPHFVIADYGVH